VHTRLGVNLGPARAQNNDPAEEFPCVAENRG
jgi:hypothetical protein